MLIESAIESWQPNVIMILCNKTEWLQSSRAKYQVHKLIPETKAEAK